MGSNEEKLSETVRKYECLYDKSHKEFHRRDSRLNAWSNVAEELGMEDGELDLI